MILRTSFVLLLLATLVVSGCAGMLVQRQGVEAAGRIALVSVVTQRLTESKREGNVPVLQDAADRAAEKVRSGLAGVRTWKVLDAANSKEGRSALASFGSANRAELAELFPQPKDQDRAQDAAAGELAAWKERFLGVRGMLIVPREALLPDEEASQKDATLRPLMLQQAGKLARALQVDAVAFAQVRYAVTHPRESAFIVTDDRTDGLLGLTVTLTIVDKTGAVIVDMGVRPINERARSQDLLPLYRGAGKDAVKPENIDLADPRKKVPRAFAALIDEAVGDVITELKTELTR